MDGLPVHRFQGLLSELANRARVTYALKPGKSEEKTILTFRQLTEPTPVQARAYELVRTSPVSGKLTLCFPLRISRILCGTSWNIGLVELPWHLTGCLTSCYRRLFLATALSMVATYETCKIFTSTAAVCAGASKVQSASGIIKLESRSSDRHP